MAEGQSNPQELKVSPRSGLYPLVYISIFKIKKISSVKKKRLIIFSLCLCHPLNSKLCGRETFCVMVMRMMMTTTTSTMTTLTTTYIFFFLFIFSSSFSSSYVCLLNHTRFINDTIFFAPGSTKSIIMPALGF